MEIEEKKTTSLTKIIEGTGMVFDIKEASTRISADRKVEESQGQIVDKQGVYCGSFSYFKRGGFNVSLTHADYTMLQATEEIIDFIKAIEAGATLSI